MKKTLCYVTDRNALPARDCGALLERIARAAAAGVEWVQLREKEAQGRELFELASRAVSGVARTATRIIVNDRLDVALASGAAGVHLGGASLPVREVAAWRRAENAPPDFFIGRSCHSLAEAQQAQQDGADYIFFGPVFETPSKAGYGPPQGLERLSEVCARAAIPVLAIGGITLENARHCFSAGAAGIAAIRLFQEAEDLDSLVRSLRPK
jgi:thiamine-phosphate pyrophosphorylase